MSISGYEISVREFINSRSIKQSLCFEIPKVRNSKVKTSAMKSSCYEIRGFKTTLSLTCVCSAWQIRGSSTVLQPINVQHGPLVL